MNPETVKKLLELAETKELIEFINSKIKELNKLDDIELNNEFEIAIEVKSRKMAVKKLVEILEPFIFSDNRELGTRNKDYEVE